MAALSTRTTNDGHHHDESSQLYADLPVFAGWHPPAGGGNKAHAGNSNADAQAGASAPHEPVNNALPTEKRRLSRSKAAAGAVAPAGAPAALQAHDAVVEVEQCAVTHPGSLTCTSVGVQVLPDNGAVVINLRATVRQTEASVVNSMSELEELGFLALQTAAKQHAASLRPRTCGTVEQDKRHLAIQHMLAEGRVTEAVKNTNEFGHVSYIVTLEDTKTNDRCKALFKPCLKGNGDGWHRVPIEAAAYKLNRLLGMDYVPPAVYRATADVDFEHFKTGGVFVYWCKHANELKGTDMREWGCSPELLMSDTRILDVLIQNSDRHAGHFLWADHWSKGRYPSDGDARLDAWHGRKHPVLIDQAAGFRPDAFVCLDHENAFLTGPTRRISATTYMRLRFLDRDTLSSVLSPYVTDEELSALVVRKDAILRYFDKLVQTKGYGAVVLEGEPHS